jgi:prevent-host-death family protein
MTKTCYDASGKNRSKQMKTVGITELKNRLSHHLEIVRRGEEIVIHHRHRPVAKLVPLNGTSEFSDEELALAAAGILRLPEKNALPENFWDAPRPRVAVKDAVKAVLDERKENRY